MKSEIKIQFDIEIKEVGNKFCCYIPKYEINFDAKNKSEIEKKSKVMVRSLIYSLVDKNNFVF